MEFEMADVWGQRPSGRPEIPEFKKNAAHNESKPSPKKDKECMAPPGNMERGNF